MEAVQSRLLARIGLGVNRLSPSAINRGRADDPRMGTLFTDHFDEAAVVLIGFPHDEGCTRNGGRSGAALGPAAFRRFVTALGPTQNPEFRVDLRPFPIFDFGDVVVHEAHGDASSRVSLEDSHKALEDAVFYVLEQGKIPFVIGGGNDQSAPNGRAALRHLESLAAAAASANGPSPPEPLGIINIDAHLDVRPLLDNRSVHSGSPFYELLSDHRTQATNGGRYFVEFACQGQQCSAEHAAFVEAHGGTLMWLSTVASCVKTSFEAAMRTAGSRCFVSFDIDAVQGSDCPGVSCPGSVGLKAQDACDIARAAGRNPSVMLMDLSELNPAVEDYRSPRLAVMVFYHFLLGLSERRQQQ